tara:strand:+ start:477 stop:1322 length:846 start_codon:yes stop_codon:yes gene_type:complete
MKQILSLGAGVQSSVVALMSEAGELPKLDCAIFADTGAEPANVYAWLDWLEARLSFPVYRVEHGNLETEDVQRRISGKTGKQYLRSSVPMWTANGGKMAGGLRRKCTRDFKIDPLRKKSRELADIRRGATEVGVRQWIGISTDEAHRMKPSRDAWVVHWWPLIDVGMSRSDCLRWMQAKGYPVPPRSSCVFCPYHSPKEWHRLQTEDPSGYQRAVDYEDKVRTGLKEWDQTTKADDVFCQKVVPNTPLSAINWAEVMHKRSAQKGFDFGEWGNECEGMCGL